MRAITIELLLALLLLPACAIRHKGAVEAFELGELAYRVHRTDGSTYIVQPPSMSSIRGTLSDLSCGKGQGCTVDVVRMSVTTETPAGPVPAPKRGIIELFGDAIAGDQALPAGTYEIYFNAYPVAPTLVFARITGPASSEVIRVKCEVEIHSQENPETELAFADSSHSGKILRKVVIRGETVTYTIP